MKRAVILFLMILSLLLVPFSSLAEDYSSKTDDALYALIDQIRAELLTRQMDSDKIIYQSDGITVYFNKAEVEDYLEGKHNLVIYITGISTSDKDLGVLFDRIFVNGWDLGQDAITVYAGKKIKTALTVYEIEDKADDILSTEDIKELEFRCYTCEPETYESLSDGTKSMIITIQ